MHIRHIGVAASIILSFIILTTGINLSKHNVYFFHYEQPVVEEVVEQNILSKKDAREVECLAKNIYHEAAFESKVGWLAVASVTMNRFISGNYADTVCGVVHQKVGSTYQFSWVGMKKRLSSIDEEVYNEILKVATLMYLEYDSSKDVTKGATFYHADYVKPKWKLERVNKIGRHIFYRSKKDVESLGV